jgi:hypothetical protein
MLKHIRLKSMNDFLLRILSKFNETHLLQLKLVFTHTIFYCFSLLFLGFFKCLFHSKNLQGLEAFHIETFLKLAYFPKYKNCLPNLFKPIFLKNALLPSVFQLVLTTSTTSLSDRLRRALCAIAMQGSELPCNRIWYTLLRAIAYLQMVLKQVLAMQGSAALCAIASNTLLRAIAYPKGVLCTSALLLCCRSH